MSLFVLSTKTFLELEIHKKFVKLAVIFAVNIFRGHFFMVDIFRGHFLRSIFSAVIFCGHFVLVILQILVINLD